MEKSPNERILCIDRVDGNVTRDSDRTWGRKLCCLQKVRSGGKGQRDKSRSVGVQGFLLLFSLCSAFAVWLSVTESASLCIWEIGQQEYHGSQWAARCAANGEAVNDMSFVILLPHSRHPISFLISGEKQKGKHSFMRKLFTDAHWWNTASSLKSSSSDLWSWLLSWRISSRNKCMKSIVFDKLNDFAFS